MTTLSSFTPHPVPDGITEVNGRRYMADAKGGLVPVELIKPQHQLEDEIVRKIMGFALALSAQVGRFKGHTYEDLGEFDALLQQQYGVTKGGSKGNRSYKTHDGLYEVEVRVQDQIEFGPELQIAKTLVDECLNEWAEDARPEIRAIVTRAFNTDCAPRSLSQTLRHADWIALHAEASAFMDADLAHLAPADREMVERACDLIHEINPGRGWPGARDAWLSRAFDLAQMGLLRLPQS